MKNLITLIILLFISSIVCSQSIDRIEAIIGDEIILTSDIESQYSQYLLQGNVRSDSVKCRIIEDLLFQKLLINKAKIDSIQISDDEVETEIKNRFNYFESQLGSLERVLEYFDKTKAEIELELGAVIKNQF